MNHAALSAKVIIESGVLRTHLEKERKAITDAVTLHNVFTIPGSLDNETLLFTRLIRDADKLDIWRIFIEYYRMPSENRPDAIGLSLPRTPGYSADVLACLTRGEMVNNTLIRNESDFKLLQLSWVYDLNFPGAFSLMAEQGYIDDLTATLPKDDAVRKAVDCVRDYVERRRR